MSIEIELKCKFFNKIVQNASFDLTKNIFQVDREHVG